MTSFYDLLGVEPTADKDEIRSAYQAKRAVDGGTGDAAKLNEAWSVLSDPYQRGRYDQKLLSGDDSAEVMSGDDIEVINDAPRPKGFFASLQNQKKQGAKAPVIVLPNGDVPAPNNRRILGVLIDGLGFFAIFVAVSVLGERLADITRDDDGKIISGNVALMTTIILGGFTVVYLLVEVVSTHAKGQTVGRRIARVKVVDRATGALPTWAQAFKRSVVPLAVLIVTYPLLGQLAFLLVLAVVMWSYADPGKQGFHDKWAKTIVVDAAVKR